MAKGERTLDGRAAEPACATGDEIRNQVGRAVREQHGPTVLRSLRAFSTLMFTKKITFKELKSLFSVAAVAGGGGPFPHR